MAKITALSYVIPVRDLDKAVAFYSTAFELQEVFRNEGIVFVGMPGGDTAIGLLLDQERAGSGPQYVGVHLDHALDHDAAVRGVESAGARVLERGEHAPGVPFARIADPDGNELWL
jgi:predicted enzyme related to lactoylglutathione lyase